MKKYIAIGLGVAVLLVVMMACGQQAQEPQEKQEQPTQEVQQSESVSPEPTVPPVETEPQDEPKMTENTEPTEPVRVEDDQQAKTEPIVEPTTKPQENKPQEPPKSPAGQTEPPSNSGGGDDDMAAIEQAMMENFLKDREEAAAQGGAVSNDVTTGAGYEDIGTQLNQGIQTTTPPETSGGETPKQTSVPSTQQSGTVWEQAFYDTLTPQQQEFYKNADDSTRRQMKATIEADRQLEQQGYQGDGNISAEDNRETWGNITVGG